MSSVVVLLLAAGMVYYYQGVLIPLRQKEFQVGGGPAGNWSDLYPRWLGARELVWHGRSPYSRGVTEEIERGFYGPGLFDAKKFSDPQAFAYPIYVVFLFAPFLHLSFGAVRAVFTTVFLLLTAASVLLWLRALKFRMRPSTTFLVFLLVMSSYPVVDGLVLEQLTMLVAGLAAASLAGLAGGNLLLAGVLLALASIKPQLVMLLSGFVLLWSLGAWEERKRFTLAFGGTMAVMLIGSEWLLPGWFGAWLGQAHAYVGYVKPSFLGSLLGRTGGMVAGLTGVVICIALFWHFRKEVAGSTGFNFALVSALVLTILLVPGAGNAKYNQVLLLPAVFWVCVTGWRLGKRSSLARGLWLLTLAALAGQWVLALAISFAAVVLHHHFQREATLFVASPEILMYLFPLLLTLFVISVTAQMLRSHRSLTE